MASMYPDYCRAYSIGKSVRGTDMWALTVSKQYVHKAFSLSLFIFLDEICSSSSLSFFLPIDTFFSLLSFHCLLIIGRMAFQTQ